MTDQDRRMLEMNVEQVGYALLHVHGKLADDVAQALQRRGAFVTTTTPTCSLLNALTKALVGWSGYDYKTETSTSAIDNLSEKRQKELLERDLPNLETAMSVFAAVMTTSIETAYRAGLAEGSDLLSKLAAGTVSVDEFNKKTTGGP